MSKFTPVRIAFTYTEPEVGEAVQEPVIFLHGMGQSKEYWMIVPVIVANATKRKVYVLDARNHGDSEWSDVFDFDVNADDVIDFMDAHNIPKAVLVGHSMGAVAAYKVALKAPERVEKIIAEDMSPKELNADRVAFFPILFGLQMEAVRTLQEATEITDAEVYIRQYIFDHVPQDLKDLWSFRTPNDLLNPIPNLKVSDEGRYEIKTNLEVLKQMFENKKYFLPYEGVYHGPVCVIYGTQSPANVGNDEGVIKKYFPNAELVAIEGASHLVHADCPDEFTDILLKFMT